MSIEARIASATRFGQQAEELVVRRGSCPSGDRNCLLLGYWSLTFDFHKGVLCLLKAHFPSAAAALVRPMIEAMIRAHIVIMGSDEDLERIRRDKYMVKFATIGAEIDEFFGLNGRLEKFLEDSRPLLHSLTHAGIFQLSRRFRGDDLIASFPEGEILEIINVVTSALFMVNDIVTKHFGFRERMQVNMRLFWEWGKEK